MGALHTTPKSQRVPLPVLCCATFAGVRVRVHVCAYACACAGIRVCVCARARTRMCSQSKVSQVECTLILYPTYSVSKLTQKPIRHHPNDSAPQPGPPTPSPPLPIPCHVVIAHGPFAGGRGRDETMVPPPPFRSCPSLPSPTSIPDLIPRPIPTPDLNPIYLGAWGLLRLDVRHHSHHSTLQPGLHPLVCVAAGR